MTSATPGGGRRALIGGSQKSQSDGAVGSHDELGIGRRLQLQQAVERCQIVRERPRGQTRDVPLRRITQSKLAGSALECAPLPKDREEAARPVRGGDPLNLVGFGEQDVPWAERLVGTPQPTLPDISWLEPSSMDAQNMSESRVRGLLQQVTDQNSTSVKLLKR
jgi:hypothetical protein